MATAEILSLISRWLHILAGMAAVGGTIFTLFVLWPSQHVLAPEARQALHVEMRRRWSKIVMTAIGLLLVTGLYNFFVIAQAFRGQLPKWYHPMFGVKFLLALVLFFLASLLAGRTPLAERLRANGRKWLGVNLVLAVLIVCISGVLRTAHPPLPPEERSEAPRFSAGQP